MHPTGNDAADRTLDIAVYVAFNPPGHIAFNDGRIGAALRQADALTYRAMHCAAYVSFDARADLAGFAFKLADNCPYRPGNLSGYSLA